MSDEVRPNNQTDDDPFAGFVRSNESAPILSEAHRQEVDFARNLMRFTPHVWVTWLIIAANFLVFVVMVITDLDALLTPSTEMLLSWGANYAPLSLRAESWRFFTAMFLHIGILHLAFNMYALAIVGQQMERFVGHMGFLLLYVISGLIGSMASSSWNQDVVSAGASGAVFGVYGALIGIALRQRGAFPKSVAEELGQSALGFIGYNVLYGLTRSGIDQAAHFGGLAGGLLCGLLLCHPITEAGVRRRPMLSVVTAVVMALVMAGVRYSMPSPQADVIGMFREFGPIESAALATYNAGLTSAQKGELSEKDLSDVIERDVLAQWSAFRVRMESEPAIPQRHQVLWKKMIAYLRAREDAWTIIKDGLRASDGTEVAKGFERMQAANELAKQIGAK